ncbi:hypothetical protein A0U40_09870 [[Bacillus] sp. KCTC 13219]|nr:hypothetical protein A0U40_09870 [[Bacillus] sp. KCTC 13219]
MFRGGKGTEKDPFIIETVEDLMNVRIKNMEYPFYYYRQNAHIDLTGVEWLPIGNPVSGEPTFMGVYDGGGWEIRNLTMNEADNYYSAMFAIASNSAQLLDVHLINASITGMTSGSFALLVSAMSGNTVIENCSVHGKIIDTVGGSQAAGLAVSASPEGIINKCCADIEITCERTAGLVLYPNGKIMNSFAKGIIQKAEGDYGFQYGFAGYGEAEVKNCYSLVDIRNIARYANSFTFADVEGYEFCYVDVETYGSSDEWVLGHDYYGEQSFVRGTDGKVYYTESQGGTDYTGDPYPGAPNYNPNWGGPYYAAKPITGADWSIFWQQVLGNPKFPEARTTSQMLTQSNYVGWDFETIWQWIEGDYPKLRFPLPRKIKKCKAMKLGALRGRR